ncbi:hypothetical protein BSL78_26689 [Apostichopus japonicus]|uniref:SEA domain-containing protein n=1 Tax=Stichopus japonicus TaxID=307972 RepID=A0A2G8JL93_STIJA|nr:hypothetical protein BSL78_26689 [Apostichopus japonicus]
MARSVSGEISTISGKQSYEKQKKQSTLCLILLLLVLVFIIVGIAVALVLTLAPPTSVDTTGTQSGPALISGTVTLQRNFTDNLLDDTTEEYRELEDEFISYMVDVFNNGSLGEYFYALEVSGFRNGSVVVYWTLTLTQLPPGITDPDELVTNANFQAFIREEIQNGIDNGNLPGLPVNRNSVAVIQINYLAPDSLPPQQPQVSPDGTNQNIGNLFPLRLRLKNTLMP